MARTSSSTHSLFSRRAFATSLAAVGMLGIAGQSVCADETTSKATEHPLIPALAHARTCMETVKKLSGYESKFTKTEVVGKQTVSQTIKIKVRHEPFSVYMYFAEPHAGREVIFVEGRNNNNLLVHEDKVSVVLDWEISHMGDPAEDIGWLMYQFRSDATRECFMDEYRKSGGEDFDTYRLKYYDVVASLKMLIAMSDIGDKFESVPGASVHLCAYAVPYLKDPASAISKQIEEAEKLRRG